MTTPSTPPTPPRSVAEIEADLARTRLELSETLDALKERVDPRVRAEELSELAKAKASALADQTRARAAAAGEEAKKFADDVVARKPRALVVVGAAVALVAGVVVLAGRRRS